MSIYIVLSQLITPYLHLSHNFRRKRWDRKWKLGSTCLITRYRMYGRLYLSLSHLIYTYHTISKVKLRIETWKCRSTCLITPYHMFGRFYHSLSHLIYTYHTISGGKWDRKWKFRSTYVITLYHMFGRLYHSLSHVIYTYHTISEGKDEIESETSDQHMLSHLITCFAGFITAYHTCLLYTSDAADE